ncbi:hypothetical protein N431DRAFT_348492 [Stipitochalara longipes BDJ]|nr:hypothetical protein N431DRAFT_348492 [Stipitochalara longipes BDJ]
MAEDSIRRRAACDRCHSQKIRCPRKPGQEICDRCQKARTPCIFSPFRQKKVPEGGPGADEGSVVTPASNEQSYTAGAGSSSTHRKRQRVHSTIEGEESINFDQDFTILEGCVPDDTAAGDAMNDWMSNPLPAFQNFPDSTFDDLNLIGQTPFLSMDIAGTWSSTFNEPPPKGVDGMIQARKDANLSRTIKNTSNLADILPPRSNPLDAYGYSNNGNLNFELLESHSESDCIRKLSQLSTDLFDHSNTIPPISIYDTPASMEDHGLPQGTQACEDYSKYRPSETFRLTQTLIDMYPAFLNAFLPHPTSRSSNTSSTWSSESMSNTHFETAQHSSASSTSPSQKNSTQSLDHSSILLILSCHLRLISIYEALFQHMQACFDQRGVAMTAQQATLEAPQLKIGDFAPPPSAAVPMQMLLLVQFASRLYNYAADLAAEIREPESSTPQSDSSSGTSSDDTLALTRAAAENVKSRASHMSQELGAMRILMLQTGHLA